MNKSEEKETFTQLFHRTTTILKNHSTITRYQIELRLATDRKNAEKIYIKLKEKEVISQEIWEDKPGGRMIVGIIDKKRLKEVRAELMRQ